MSNLGRTDVERIIENVLTNLNITVTTPDKFISPNDRKIELKYKDTVLSTAYLDVVEKPEYDG